ncbi:MAG: hypothetical protein AAFO76_13280 [Cyanobacteria bacterium J06607_15]
MNSSILRFWGIKNLKSDNSIFRYSERSPKLSSQTKAEGIKSPFCTSRHSAFKGKALVNFAIAN